MLNEQKARKKREAAIVSEHLLVGMKIAISVFFSMGLYTSYDARSCVNDDCFDMPAYAKHKNFSQKKVCYLRFQTFQC